jgi:translation elongation factor EF-1beta
VAKSNIVLDVKPWDDETGKNNIYKYCQDDKNSKQFHFLWPQIVDK